MSVVASLKFTQLASSPGPGIAMMGVVGSPVTCSNGNDANVYNWTYEFLDVPTGSALTSGVKQDGPLPTFTFTPDVTGAYEMLITVKDPDGNTATSELCFGVVRASGRFMPSFRSTDRSLNAAGNKRGWAKYMEEWLTFLDGLGTVTRVTALDANHLHAWELTESSGNAVDTGSSAAKVNLVASGTGIVYTHPGIAGNCVQFGWTPAGAVGSASQYSALVSAFSDLPSTLCTLEAIACFYTNGGASMCGVSCSGSYNFELHQNGSYGFTGTCRATSFVSIGPSSGTGYQNWGTTVPHYIAMVQDGSNTLIYVDGELLSAGANTGTIQWSNGTTPKFYLGYDPNNPTGQMTGLLSRVRLSNIPRSLGYFRNVWKTLNIF